MATPLPTPPSLALQIAVPMLDDAREDWKILRALSEVLGVTLPVER